MYVKHYNLKMLVGTAEKLKYRKNSKRTNSDSVLNFKFDILRSIHSDIKTNITILVRES